MKKLLLFFLLGFSLNAGHSQCFSASSFGILDVNNIKARFNTGGRLFNDGFDPVFIPKILPNVTNPPSTVFSASVWLGGITPAGDIKLTTVTYNGFGGLAAGPLMEDGSTDNLTCQRWDRVFKVKGVDIQSFIEAMPLTQTDAIAQYPSIMGWPALGNPYFATVHGFSLPANNSPLAAFNDADQDGLYDPLKGDFPVVKLRDRDQFVPEEILWSVANSVGTSNNILGTTIMEIQLTAWAFNCPEQDILYNTVFTSHKLISREDEPLDSFYIALWVDPDLGCFMDDYMGCNPALSTAFMYNQDAVDDEPECQGLAVFGNFPPIQSITVLNRPMEKFILPNNPGYGNPIQGTTDPFTVQEYYNYLTGSWRDGSPLTFGGEGYGGTMPTDHAFPDNPSNANGWSMCTSNTPKSDRRFVTSSKLGTMNPGQVEEMTVAWTVHPKTPGLCSIGQSLNEVANIRDEFDISFDNTCSPVSIKEVAWHDKVEVFPNPSSGEAVVKYGEMPVDEIQLFDQTGKLVLSLEPGSNGSTTISGRLLPQGLYIIQLTSKKEIVRKKWSVLR